MTMDACDVGWLVPRHVRTKCDGSDCFDTPRGDLSTRSSERNIVYDVHVETTSNTSPNLMHVVLCDVRREDLSEYETEVA